MKGVNRQLRVTTGSDWTMKIAFASSDLHIVDQHFGSAIRLVTYGVKPDATCLLNVADFGRQCGHDQDKLQLRIDAVDDCVTLFCVAIGDAVFRQLLQVGVRAVRVPEGTPILVLLNQLQQHWDAPHLAHVKPPRDPQRFASLANETQWQDED